MEEYSSELALFSFIDIMFLASHYIEISKQWKT